MTPVTWSELEEPVLTWVVDPEVEDLRLDFGDSTSPLSPQLNDTQVDEALSRLLGHGLIAGIRQEGSGAVWWSSLRIAADGLRVLGEWPPVEAATINEALVLILRELSGELPDEEAAATRRASTAVGKMSAETVWDAVKGEARRAGGELGS